MHAYSTDSGERRVLPLFVAVAAIGASIGALHLLRLARIEVPGWLSPLDTMTFYGLLYWVFDRVMWKWRWIHSLSVTRIPNLSGTWRGEVRTTSGESAGATTEIEMVVQQSWTEISLRGHTRQSTSQSLSAHMVVSDERVLSYEYRNEPLASASTTMHAHRGSARLWIENGDRVLKGDYYSGRDRQTIGTIHLTRK